jgi:hypothetical protein
MTWAALTAANGVAKATLVAGGVRVWPPPFDWLLTLANTQKGEAGLIMVRELAKTFGYVIAGAALTQSFTLKEYVVKVKLCLQWKDGKIVFEQIEDDSYTHLAMLGLEPATGWLWISTKADALTNSDAQHKKPSRWVGFKPTKQPAWLVARGGSIANAQATFLNAFGPPP